MTAQKLAGPTNGNHQRQIFDAERLCEEMQHEHPARRAAACAATRAVLALAEDRFIFFEGTRSEVWAHIFDADQLQAEIDRGRPSRLRPADPLRAVGAQLVVDAIARVITLRSSTEAAGASSGVADIVVDEEVHRLRQRLAAWMRPSLSERQAA